MKKNLLVITFLLVTVFAFGQKLPFQGKLILNGAPVTTTQTFVFEINSIGWSETHTDVPVTDGLYFVVLGNINPLPDSLFSGVTEQNMNISVNGTALSPVVLFKPLSAPFEGTELNVRNLEGTVVGTLKARTDSVKHGEFKLLGENSGKIKAGFFKANEEPDTDMPFLSLQKDSTVLSYLSTTKWNNAFNGRLYLGSTNGDNANVYPNLYTGRHNGRTLFQVGHASWNNSENFGLLTLNGPNSGNFEITGQHWDNPDLPFFKMRGSNNQDVLILSAESDSLESGNLRIYSQSGNSVYMNAEHINIAATNGNNYIGHDQIDIASHTENKKVVLNPNSIEIIDTEDENNWKGMFNLTSQNWNSNGSSGLFRTYGPTTQNFEMTGKSWEDPDLPWFKISGKENHDAIQLSVDNDSVETAFINLNSLDGSSSSLNSRSLGIRGPSSQNIDMGSKEWEDKDFGYINMWGRNNGNNDFHAMEISVSEDGNGDQFGYISLNSENGKNLHLSPDGFGVEGAGMNSNPSPNGNSGYLFTRGPNSTNFETGGDYDNPDRAYLNMNGNTDENRLRFAIYEDGAGNEYGNIEIRSANNRQAVIEPDNFAFVNTENWTETMSIRNEDNGQGGKLAVMHLNSDESKSAYMDARTIALRDDANGYHHLIDMSTNNDTGNGWVGNFNVRGPNSDNIQMGNNGSNPDLPWVGLNGERINLMHFTGISDANNEFGYLHLTSEDGSTSNISAYRMENNNGAGMNGYFGHDRTEFDDNGQTMTYNAYGISGSSPLEMYNGATVHGDFDVNGHITAISVTETSDKRFKKDIQSIGNNTLQKVKLLDGVSYNWRQDEFPEKNFSSDKQIGVIAQDLEAQFPALVKTDKEGYKSVNYNGFTAVLLEAVKELNAKVEKLETENIQLKAELSASAKNTSEIADLNEQMEALVKMVQLQQTEESIDEITSTPGLK